MAGANTSETIAADNAHLPTVSVFIVLLAMMAALTTYTNISKDNFKAAKLSLVDTFAPENHGFQADKKSLPKWLKSDLAQVCNDFGATCLITSSASAEGVSIAFPASAYDATLRGLTPAEQKFLKQLGKVCANQPLRITLNVPLKARIDDTNIFVLNDILQSEGVAAKNIAVVQSPLLQRDSSFGFVVEPQSAG